MTTFSPSDYFFLQTDHFSSILTGTFQWFLLLRQCQFRRTVFSTEPTTLLNFTIRDRRSWKSGDPACKNEHYFLQDGKKISMHGEKIVNKIVFPKKKQNNFPIMEETIAVMEKKSFIMEKTKWFIFSKIKNITCE
jgi:hypothetical protein